MPESLRGDDAERAEAPDARDNHLVELRWYAGGSPKHEMCAISACLSCELSSSRLELRLEDAPTCCLLLTASACGPFSGRSAEGHVQNTAKKGRRVDTPVAKEHGNVPPRSWQAVGLALFPVLAPLKRLTRRVDTKPIPPASDLCQTHSQAQESGKPTVKCRGTRASRDGSRLAERRGDLARRCVRLRAHQK